jgi:hypothetical protein
LGLSELAGTGTGIDRLGEAEHGNGAVACEIEVVGDTAPNRPGACRSMRGRSKAMSRVPSAKVTMITVMPQSRQSGLIRACICARVPGSSAPNGSSSSSTRGRRAIAWAIAKRCCMPPESALGYLSRCAFSPTSSIRLSLSSIAARRAALVRRDR